MNLDYIDFLRSDDVIPGSGALISTPRVKTIELLKQCQERDKDLVRIPHPKLPRTWLLVSKEKARKLGY